VHTTLVSTGLLQTPTPTGQFRIWHKFRTDGMAACLFNWADVGTLVNTHK